MVEFANLPVYLDVLDELGVSGGVEYLDVACGSGMALREAERRRATVAGIDAAEALTDIARERVPSGDIRVGDLFTSVAPRRRDSSTAVSSSLRPTPLLL